MAHFSQVDENNIVVQVLVTDNNDPAGDEGYSFLVNTFGGTWIKTSYNTRQGVHVQGGIPLRKNYGLIGYIYDPELDAFYEPKPFDSWVLNLESCIWEPPIPYPKDGKSYNWNEAVLNWVEVTK